jgi:membrane protein YdbS with pleckstrin-like domain
MRTNNSNNSNNSSSSGIGFTGLLTVAFVVLKLCGVIAWSWWWVLSPIWITILLIIAIVVLAVIVKFFTE